MYVLVALLLLGYFPVKQYRSHGAGHPPHCGHSTLPTRDRVPSGTRNPAYLVKAKNGAVASENEICSQMGVDTMKAGGNAVDAAVSTTLCIGVVNMFS